MSSGLWRWVTGWAVPNTSVNQSASVLGKRRVLFGLLDPDDEDTTILNVRNYNGWWHSISSWETRIFKNTLTVETHMPKPRDGEEKWKSSKKPSRSESRSNTDLAELLATLLGLSCSIVFMSLKAEWLTPLQTEIDIRNKCTSYTRLLSDRQKLPRFCNICFLSYMKACTVFEGILHT